MQVNILVMTTIINNAIIISFVPTMFDSPIENLLYIYILYTINVLFIVYKAYENVLFTLYIRCIYTIHLLFIIIIFVLSC